MTDLVLGFGGAALGLAGLILYFLHDVLGFWKRG